MTVADRIRQLRERLGMTQDELAERLGYNGKSSISKIETSGNDITLKKISRIAPALHTSEAYLMGWTDDPDPKAVTHLQVGDCEPEEITLHDEYYTDAQTAMFAQQLLENKEMRMLFDAAKNSKPEDLTMVTEMLKRLKGTNPDG